MCVCVCLSTASPDFSAFAEHRLQDMIHSGRLGPVHRAQWQNYTDPLAVAVKVLKQDGSHDDKISFFREAVALGQLTHPNIVRLFGLVNDGGQVCGAFGSTLPREDLCLPFEGDDGP